MKYRKKPVIIDAVQLEKTEESIIKAVNFVSGTRGGGFDFLDNAIVKMALENDGIIINTLEGDMKANFDDFIIKGVQGEFYPCKPDIFNETYEIVGENQ